MARVDVDIKSLVKIRYDLSKLQRVANNGLSKAMSSLSSIENEIRVIYRQSGERMYTLENEILRLEKQADAQQTEYNQQLKAAEEAKAQGKPYTLPYITPDDMRNEAQNKRFQVNEMKRELETLKSQMMQYKASKEVFLSEFSKIALNASDGNDDGVTTVVEKSIMILDDYVHTNISSENCSVYDNYVAQMQASNARNAQAAQRLREEHTRTL